MELTAELIRKHKDVVEATVKAHQSHSKKGKVFTVKQHERNIKSMSVKELEKEIEANGPLANKAVHELTRRINAGAPGTKSYTGSNVITKQNMSKVGNLSGKATIYISHSSKGKISRGSYDMSGKKIKADKKKAFTQGQKEGLGLPKDSGFKALRRQALKDQHALYMKNK